MVSTLVLYTRDNGFDTHTAYKKFFGSSEAEQEPVKFKVEIS